MKGKHEYAGLFEDEEDAWEAVKKKKAEAGEVAKVKDNQLPQSKHKGVTWDRKKGTDYQTIPVTSLLRHVFARIDVSALDPLPQHALVPGKWKALVTIDHKLYYVGLFEGEEKAWQAIQVPPARVQRSIDEID